MTLKIQDRFKKLFFGIIFEKKYEPIFSSMRN